MYMQLTSYMYRRVEVGFMNCGGGGPPKLHLYHPVLYHTVRPPSGATLLPLPLYLHARTHDNLIVTAQHIQELSRADSLVY